MNSPPDLQYDSFAIFPAIGIARVGNSSEYFIGPEVPGVPAGGENFKFKDATGKIKKQAARFRIYGYKNGKVVREIKHSDGAQIQWEVKLANKKASWHQFVGRHELPEGGLQKVPLRNPTIPRTSLEVTPAAQIVGGISGKARALFDGHISFGQDSSFNVHLGEAIVEFDTGRLIVTGGNGYSAAAKPGHLINQYANNDWWYDDTADGSIDATVLIDGHPLTNREGRSWVIVAPPKFSPSTPNIRTLFDCINKTQKIVKDADMVQYHRDIRPFFDSIAPLSFLNKRAKVGHNIGSLNMFYKQDLANPDESQYKLRMHIFERIRNPDLRLEQANEGYMPILSGDGGDCIDGDIKTWLTVSQPLYDKLKKWAKGDFIQDAPCMLRIEGDV